MRLTNKGHSMDYDIKKEEWHNCKLCNKKIEDLAKIFGGSNVYYTKVFIKHLKEDHNISKEEYFEKFTKRPICKCNICNKNVDIKTRGSKFSWKEYKCGRFKGIMEWSEKAKETRKGKNNPMYGATPWNKGLDNSDQRIKAIADKRRGIKTSKETKKKQKESALKRIVHGHTGKKHSEETKNFLRKNTLRLIKEGKLCGTTKTKPHLEFEKILIKNHIKYEEEKIVSYWSFDFYLVDYNVYIEVDGDYWHSNPKTYPNGPKTKSQKINYARDLSKNKYCIKNNLTLYRYWECDILNSIDKIEKELLCKLKKL